MKKKVLSIFLAIVLAASCFAVSLTAYAKIYSLVLDIPTQGTIEGEDDLVWFTYTPDVSGTYSLLGLSVPATEAYLFIKEVDKETNTKKYVQLAYAIDDPNYQENNHNSRQFCLTYHLEAGVKYYYAAGWYLSESRTSGSVKVMLRCDEYDVKIDRIEAVCPIILDAFSDGTWNTDSDGNPFFYYNISKIVANTTVTVYYPDGTSVSATGQETVDGYPIIYNHNQYYEHWYPQTDGSYTSNAVTVKVLNETAQIDIQIATVARFKVTGTITDMLGRPIENAKIMYSNAVLDETDADGQFTFYSSSGQFAYNVTASNAIDRRVIIVVAADGENDFTDTPISICTCNYENDSTINAKDYAVMLKTLEGEELASQQEQFSKSINFTADSYPLLTLNY